MYGLHGLAFVPMALAGRMRRIERRTIARLSDAGANTAERAILLEGDGKLRQFVHARLERAGALIGAGNDRYYLSRPAYDTFRGRRRLRAAVVVLAVAIVGVTMYFRGEFS